MLIVIQAACIIEVATKANFTVAGLVDFIDRDAEDEMQCYLNAILEKKCLQHSCVGFFSWIDFPGVRSKIYLQIVQSKIRRFHKSSLIWLKSFAI